MSEPQRRTARVNGITLAEHHWPGPLKPMRPPVVLLHGVLQTGAGMRHLAERPAHARPVLVPGLRGGGESDRATDGYGPATMAEDVAALLHDLDVGSPVVIG
jgi:pimeloyl-ACP methyl ester carboxylesterase